MIDGSARLRPRPGGKRGITGCLHVGLRMAKCYCGFECETESELKSHIIREHGARDGDWKGWVSR